MAADLTQPAPSPGRKRTYGERFVVVYAVLVLVFGGAIATFVVLVAKPGHHAAATWSDWKPTSSDPESMAKEIADHVSGRYRITNGGGQLVGIVSSKPAVQSVEIKAIALRPSPSDNSNIQIMLADKTEMFILCGLGSRCSIAKGKATTERGRVLRREALELALYTFKFVPRINSIIAFLPPRPGTDPQYMIFLQKTALKKQLQQPLRTTLPLAKPPTATQSDAVETPVIDRLTLPSMFKYSLTQAQDGSAILVLDPIALNG